MADESTIFPRWYFSASAPMGRVFETAEDLEAAGGPAVWFLTPTEAALAAQAAPSEGEPPTTRSRR